jgi:hypothetical protein
MVCPVKLHRGETMMDGGDVLHIGTEFAAWQIKEFSVALRKAITEAARRQEATNAEWLHGYFTRYGVDGAEVAPQTRQTLPGQPYAADLAHLIGLAEAAAKLATAPDLAVVKTARIAVRKALLAVQPQAAPRPPRLHANPPLTVQHENATGTQDS